VLARHQRLCFQLIGHFAQLVDFLAQLFHYGLAFAGQIKLSLNVLYAPGEIRVHGERFFQTPALAHQHLRFFLVSPHVGIADLLFDLS